MVSLGKKFGSMFIFVFIFSGLFFVGSCMAPVNMPLIPSAAPEVSVVVNTDHFWNSPIYTTNPYTGETTLVARGYWIPSGTIDITIKNRPVIPYTDKNGNYINVYYSVFWTIQHLSYGNTPMRTVYQSDSDYTVISLIYGSGLPHTDIWTQTEGAVWKFRVQAVIGYFGGGVFEGEGSEWVEFTVTIPKSDNPGSSSAPNTPNPSGPSVSVSYNVPQQPLRNSLP